MQFRYSAGLLPSSARQFHECDVQIQNCGGTLPLILEFDGPLSNGSLGPIGPRLDNSSSMDCIEHPSCQSMNRAGFATVCDERAWAGSRQASARS